MTTINPAQIANNYPNPLDEFRNYSYHFILTLANTTTAFEAMIGNDKNGNSPLLARVLQATSPGEEFKLDNGSTAYLVADTRRFSAYQITDVMMEHVYGTGSPNNPSVPVNTTHMRLVDATGLSFFNMLMDLFRNKLQSSRSSAFFLLTIVFTGHDAYGQTQTVSTCYIPLMMLTMEFELDHSGGIFEIDFMEMEGAPARGASMDILNNLGSIQSVTTKETDPTVGGLINALERQLNVQSLDFFQKYTNTATASGNTGKSGKLVQYMITVPQEWSTFQCKIPGRAKNTEQMFTATKTITPATKIPAKGSKTPPAKSSEPNYLQLSFSPTTTITQAIEEILNSSTNFLDLASEEKRLAGQAMTFKIIPTITSDDTTYVVHFDVYPYHCPEIDTSQGQTSSGANLLDAGSSQVIGNVSQIRNLMSYDYIYTGLNSHIIDLKIKYLPESAVALDNNLNIGQTRFAANAAEGSSAAGAKAAAENGESNTTSFAPDIRAGDPVFFALRSKDQLNNAATHKTEQLTNAEAVAALKSRQEFTQTMAYIHFLSSLSLDMTIRGNPNLIRKYADRNLRGGIPPHRPIIDGPLITSPAGASKDAATVYQNVLENSIASAKQEYYSRYVATRINGIKTSNGPDPLTGGPDVSVLPLFCQINMRYPNIDYRTGQLDSLNPYTNAFFFNGAYMVLYCQTSFSRGSFSHTLSMIPYDVSGVLTQNDSPSTAPYSKY